MQTLKWKMPEAISIFFPAKRQNLKFGNTNIVIAPVMLSALSMK